MNIFKTYALKKQILILYANIILFDIFCAIVPILSLLGENLSPIHKRFPFPHSSPSIE